MDSSLQEDQSIKVDVSIIQRAKGNQSTDSEYQQVHGYEKEKRRDNGYRKRKSFYLLHSMLDSTELVHRPITYIGEDIP